MNQFVSSDLNLDEIVLKGLTRILQECSEPGAGPIASASYNELVSFLAETDLRPKETFAGVIRDYLLSYSSQLDIGVVEQTLYNREAERINASISQFGLFGYVTATGFVSASLFLREPVVAAVGIGIGLLSAAYVGGRPTVPILHSSSHKKLYTLEDFRILKDANNVGMLFAIETNRPQIDRLVG